MTAGITCPPDRVDPTHEMSSCAGERLVGEPLTEVLVGLEETADRQQHMDQEQAEKYHQRDEERVPSEQRHDEDANWIRRPEPQGEAIGEAIRSRLEDRRNGSTPRSFVIASLEGRTRDGYCLRLGVHGVVFTRRTPG